MNLNLWCKCEIPNFFWRLIFVHRNLKPHPNVIKVIGVCKEPHLAIVLEYMKNGSLEQLVFNHEIKLETKQLIAIAKDIASGVKKKKHQR